MIMKLFKMCEYICERDRVNGEKKLRKGWERQGIWIFLKCADLSHCSVLVTGLPSSAASTFLLGRWKFSQDVEDTKALFLNTAWWFTPRAEVRKDGIGAWNFSACTKGERDCGCSEKLGESQSWPLDTGFMKRGAELEPYQIYLSVLQMAWEGNPETACWDEPG